MKPIGANMGVGARAFEGAAAVRGALQRRGAVSHSDAGDETGCGKDVLARVIHPRSGRKGDFIAINCGAIPDSPRRLLTELENAEAACSVRFASTIGQVYATPKTRPGPAALRPMRCTHASLKRRSLDDAP